MKRLLPTHALVLLRERLGTVGVMDYHEPIYLGLESSLEFTERLGSAAKEPETIAWIEEFVKPDDVLADVGANVGAYALVAAKATKNRATVYAFEPAFANYAALCRNIHLNGCADSIVPFAVALSDRTAMDPFRYSSLDAGSALHASIAAPDSQTQGDRAVFEHSLLTFRLDDLIELMSLQTPNHIKVDVDGNELLVLKGAERTLSSPALRSLLVEIDDDSSEGTEILAFLKSKGFSPLSKHAYPFETETHTYYNYIFTRDA